MTKDEALQMCLEYIETDAHERRHVRWAIKEALAQPEQEPVAYSGNGTAGREADVRPTGFCFQMPKRTWVGLTDEEIQECYSEAYKIVQGRQLEIAFYKTIEAKLKENNNG